MTDTMQPSSVTDEAFVELMLSLRKPRETATAEVNFLLASEASRMRAELEQTDNELDSWQSGVTSQLDRLEDEPSTGYDVEGRRDRFEAERSGIEGQRTQSLLNYDTRRETFAAMLVSVQASHRVRLDPEVAAEIRQLNADDYLATAMGMSSEAFDAYYGGTSVSTPDFSRRGLSPVEPVYAPQAPQPDHTVVQGLFGRRFVDRTGRPTVVEADLDIPEFG